MTEAVRVAGPLAEHPEAEAFARVIERVHHRYAAEVVGAFSLCPFMKEPASAFGCFCVILDRELSLELAAEQVMAADSSVVHLIYPLTEEPAASFERFGNRLHETLARRIPSPPVHASFHPEMRGDRGNAARLVGLVRRAPDPFVQFVPDGLHQGGSTFIDPSTIDLPQLLHLGSAKPHRSLGDLSVEQLDDLEQRLQDIRRDRHDSYAPFLRAFA